MKKIILLSLMVLSIGASAQEVALISNEDTYIGCQKKGAFVEIVIEDLQPDQQSSNGAVPDFKEESDIDYCLIEFDKNADHSVNKGDIGFQLSGLNGYVYELAARTFGNMGTCAYQLYAGFPGIFMHRNSRGCDNKATKAVLASSWHSSTHSGSGHPIWRLTIPLKEVAMPTAKEVLVRVKVYRRITKQVFSYPEVLHGNSFAGMAFALASNPIASDEKKESESAHASSKKHSLQQYRAAAAYDGVYIDMGNGKFAELVEVSPGHGLFTAHAGKQDTKYFTRIPFVSSVSTSVNVPKVKKIIFKGAGFGGSFIDGIRISKLENINELGVTADVRGRKDEVSVYELAGQFGSAYSFKSEQPDILLTPSINKANFQDVGYIEFNKKTVSQTTSELYLSDPLERGSVYAIWNNAAFWLFKVE